LVGLDEGINLIAQLFCLLIDALAESQGVALGILTR
jgi:hypothetical protein